MFNLAGFLRKRLFITFVTVYLSVVNILSTGGLPKVLDKDHGSAGLECFNESVNPYDYFDAAGLNDPIDDVDSKYKGPCSPTVINFDTDLQKMDKFEFINSVFKLESTEFDVVCATDNEVPVISKLKAVIRELANPKKQNLTVFNSNEKLIIYVLKDHWIDPKIFVKMSVNVGHISTDEEAGLWKEKLSRLSNAVNSKLNHVVFLFEFAREKVETVEKAAEEAAKVVAIIPNYERPYKEEKYIFYKDEIVYNKGDLRLIIKNDRLMMDFDINDNVQHPGDFSNNEPRFPETSLKLINNIKGMDYSIRNYDLYTVVNETETGIPLECPIQLKFDIAMDETGAGSPYQMSETFTFVGRMAQGVTSLSNYVFGNSELKLIRIPNILLLSSGPHDNDDFLYIKYNFNRYVLFNGNVKSLLSSSGEALKPKDMFDIKEYSKGPDMLERLYPAVVVETEAGSKNKIVDISSLVGKSITKKDYVKDDEKFDIKVTINDININNESVPLSQITAVFSIFKKVDNALIDVSVAKNTEFKSVLKALAGLLIQREVSLLIGEQVTDENADKIKILDFFEKYAEEEQKKGYTLTFQDSSQVQIRGDIVKKENNYIDKYVQLLKSEASSKREYIKGSSITPGQFEMYERFIESIDAELAKIDSSMFNVDNLKLTKTDIDKDNAMLSFLVGCEDWETYSGSNNQLILYRLQSNLRELFKFDNADMPEISIVPSSLLRLAVAIDEADRSEYILFTAKLKGGSYSNKFIPTIIKIKRFRSSFPIYNSEKLMLAQGPMFDTNQEFYVFTSKIVNSREGLDSVLLFPDYRSKDPSSLALEVKRYNGNIDLNLTAMKQGTDDHNRLKMYMLGKESLYKRAVKGTVSASTAYILMPEDTLVDQDFNVKIWKRGGQHAREKLADTLINFNKCTSPNISNVNEEVHLGKITLNSNHQRAVFRIFVSYKELAKKKRVFGNISSVDIVEFSSLCRIGAGASDAIDSMKLPYLNGLNSTGVKKSISYSTADGYNIMLEIDDLKKIYEIYRDMTNHEAVDALSFYIRLNFITDTGKIITEQIRRKVIVNFEDNPDEDDANLLSDSVLREYEDSRAANLSFEKLAVDKFPHVILQVSTMFEKHIENIEISERLKENIDSANISNLTSMKNSFFSYSLYSAQNNTDTSGGNEISIPKNAYGVGNELRIVVLCEDSDFDKYINRDKIIAYIESGRGTHYIADSEIRMVYANTSAGQLSRYMSVKLDNIKHLIESGNCTLNIVVFPTVKIRGYFTDILKTSDSFSYGDIKANLATYELKDKFQDIFIKFKSPNRFSFKLIEGENVTLNSEPVKYEVETKYSEQFADDYDPLDPLKDIGKTSFNVSFDGFKSTDNANGISCNLFFGIDMRSGGSLANLDEVHFVYGSINDDYFRFDNARFMQLNGRSALFRVGPKLTSTNTNMKISKVLVVRNGFRVLLNSLNKTLTNISNEKDRLINAVYNEEESKLIIAADTTLLPATILLKRSDGTVIDTKVIASGRRISSKSFRIETEFTNIQIDSLNGLILAIADKVYDIKLFDIPRDKTFNAYQLDRRRIGYPNEVQILNNADYYWSHFIIGSTLKIDNPNAFVSSDSDATLNVDVKEIELKYKGTLTSPDKDFEVVELSTAGKIDKMTGKALAGTKALDLYAKYEKLFIDEARDETVGHQTSLSNYYEFIVIDNIVELVEKKHISDKTVTTHEARLLGGYSGDAIFGDSNKIIFRPECSMDLDTAPRIIGKYFNFLNFKSSNGAVKSNVVIKSQLVDNQIKFYRTRGSNLQINVNKNFFPFSKEFLDKYMLLANKLESELNIEDYKFYLKSLLLKGSQDLLISYLQLGGAVLKGDVEKIGLTYKKERDKFIIDQLGEIDGRIKRIQSDRKWWNTFFSVIKFISTTALNLMPGGGTVASLILDKCISMFEYDMTGETSIGVSLSDFGLGGSVLKDLSLGMKVKKTRKGAVLGGLSGGLSIGAATGTLDYDFSRGSFTGGLSTRIQGITDTGLGSKNSPFDFGTKYSLEDGLGVTASAGYSFGKLNAKGGLGYSFKSGMLDSSVSGSFKAGMFTGEAGLTLVCDTKNMKWKSISGYLDGKVDYDDGPIDRSTNLGAGRIEMGVERGKDSSSFFFKGKAYTLGMQLLSYEYMRDPKTGKMKSTISDFSSPEYVGGLIKALVKEGAFAVTDFRVRSETKKTMDEMAKEVAERTKKEIDEFNEQQMRERAKGKEGLGSEEQIKMKEAIVKKVTEDAMKTVCQAIVDKYSGAKLGGESFNMSLGYLKSKVQEEVDKKDGALGQALQSAFADIYQQKADLTLFGETKKLAQLMTKELSQDGSCIGVTDADSTSTAVQNLMKLGSEEVPISFQVTDKHTGKQINIEKKFIPTIKIDTKDCKIPDMFAVDIPELTEIIDGKEVKFGGGKRFYKLDKKENTYIVCSEITPDDMDGQKIELKDLSIKIEKGLTVIAVESLKDAVVKKLSVGTEESLQATKQHYDDLKGKVGPLSAEETKFVNVYEAVPRTGLEDVNVIYKRANIFISKEGEETRFEDKDGVFSSAELKMGDKTIFQVETTTAVVENVFRALDSGGLTKENFAEKSKEAVDKFRASMEKVRDRVDETLTKLTSEHFSVGRVGSSMLANKGRVDAMIATIRGGYETEAVKLESILKKVLVDVETGAKDADEAWKEAKYEISKQIKYFELDSSEGSKSGLKTKAIVENMIIPMDIDPTGLSSINRELVALKLADQGVKEVDDFFKAKDKKKALTGEEYVQMFEKIFKSDLSEQEKSKAIYEILKSASAGKENVSGLFDRKCYQWIAEHERQVFASGKDFSLLNDKRMVDLSKEFKEYSEASKINKVHEAEAYAAFCNGNRLFYKKEELDTDKIKMVVRRMSKIDISPQNGKMVVSFNKGIKIPEDEKKLLDSVVKEMNQKIEELGRDAMDKDKVTEALKAYVVDNGIACVQAMGISMIRPNLGHYAIIGSIEDKVKGTKIMERQLEKVEKPKFGCFAHSGARSTMELFDGFAYTGSDYQLQRVDVERKAKLIDLPVKSKKTGKPTPYKNDRQEIKTIRIDFGGKREVWFDTKDRAGKKGSESDSYTPKTFINPDPLTGAVGWKFKFILETEKGE